MHGFIINKTSGNGRGEKVWARVEKALKEKNLSYSARFTEGPKHAVELVPGLLRENIKALVVLGGDGTINEVANGLVYCNIPLGVIPAGSGNDFARCLGIPMDSLQALERILVNDPKQVDLLDLGSRYCLTVTGVGFDGQVAKTVNEAPYKKPLNQFRLGGLSYVVSMLETLTTYEPTRVHVTVDGVEKIYEDVWLVAVANSPNYGGGIHICPEASYNDGLLNLCIVHGIKKWELLWLFPQAYKGRHVNKVTLLQGEEVYISSNPPVLVQSDGEQFMESPVYIRVEKNAIRVV
ncbi:diacylglycerol/lipid kinase family protein [Salipaludibacillus aurantiacus]|uniref:Lipid kinase, YegS/Rv2252/BmrU family n=1 Tax=Salipaludibacillus aurantiacus TaxID=1601833 RepID=A0A1H9NWP5_9BACI|nr:diacylglycerol kinase family protein [Salipaludibacillus aurantiacus]SER40217.1 lipid kinase, YegS/Rv2252/BmrU family [Salipaludibacillus aurantiacus]